MRRLSVPRGGGERLGVLAFEVAALMSRAAGLWRALGDLRGEAAIRLEGVRRLVADDDAALLRLAVAELGGACGDLARAVARLSARCADPLLRRFDALFAALVAGGPGADAHGLRYAAAGGTGKKKMDRRAREMLGLAAATAHLCHELDVLAEVEKQQGLRSRVVGEAAAAAACRVARRQRQEVERLRADSLWERTFDYAIRLLARSLFTIVARIMEEFDLEPTNAASTVSFSSSNKVPRLGSFVGNGNSTLQALVYPSDVAAAAADSTHRTVCAKPGKQVTRSKSLKQQLRWPAAAGKHLIRCVVDGSESPDSAGSWIILDDGRVPLRTFSYLPATRNVEDHSTSSSRSIHSQLDHRSNPTLWSTSVFESSTHAVLASAPEPTLGAAGLATHYARLVILIERLAAAGPHLISPDERDDLYGMLTAGIRASLRSRIKPPPLARRGSSSCECDDAAEWAGTVHGILGWLAPLAHNTVRWQGERKLERRSEAAASASPSVLLLETLHFADRGKTEDAVTELLVGLNHLWWSGNELDQSKSADSWNYDDCADYVD